MNNVAEILRSLIASILSDPAEGAELGEIFHAAVSMQDNDGRAPFPFHESFESGALSNYWWSYSTTYGRVGIATNNGPLAGSCHLTMESSTYGACALNELILTADLAGQDGPGGYRFDDARISFWVGNVALAIIGELLIVYYTVFDFDTCRRDAQVRVVGQRLLHLCVESRIGERGEPAAGHGPGRCTFGHPLARRGQVRQRLRPDLLRLRRRTERASAQRGQHRNRKRGGTRVHGLSAA